VGRRIKIAGSGGGFHARPLWTRFWKRELVGPAGERIQVEAGRAPKLESILREPDGVAALPEASVRRFEVYEDDDPDWPGLILRVSGIDTSVVARVSTVALARRLADLLNRLAAEDARRPRSARYWFRIPW
jgi:hypothetical protein